MAGYEASKEQTGWPGPGKPPGACTLLQGCIQGVLQPACQGAPLGSVPAFCSSPEAQAWLPAARSALEGLTSDPSNACSLPLGTEPTN